MTEKDEEFYRNYEVCRFCRKEIFDDKFTDLCHLTGKIRVETHNKCDVNVTQKEQSNFILFVFQIFSNYKCHLFFKKLVDQKNDKVKFDIIPETNKENISVTYG